MVVGIIFLSLYPERRTQPILRKLKLKEMTRNDYKTKAYDFGMFNAWKGNVGLYFNQKDCRAMKKFLGIDIRDLNIRQLWEIL